VKTLADAHEVYMTLFPADNGGGQRFTAKFTDEQLQAFRDTRQYYDSLTKSSSRLPQNDDEAISICRTGRALLSAGERTSER